jgi:hypothetical protein
VTLGYKSPKQYLDDWLTDQNGRKDRKYESHFLVDKNPREGQEHT